MPKNPTDKPAGRAVKLPADVYTDLLRLQGVYPGKTLSEIAELLIRRALEEDQDLLAKLRQMQKTDPP